MEKKLSVVFNRKGNTLDVWFDSPEKEAVCEETGGEVILKKDGRGRVIGFEKLNYLAPAQLKHAPSRLPVEVVVD